MNKNRGYTLVELVVAVGLFAVVMLLASGAYLIMIGLNRQVQGIATGINNLSFALETMTRTIRTGSQYGCPSAGVDCPSGGSDFVVLNESGQEMRYTLSVTNGSGVIMQNDVALTDPTVNVSSLTFYSFGTTSGDGYQPHVTIVVSGTVSYGAGKSEPFTVETGATMRGPDL